MKEIAGVSLTIGAPAEKVWKVIASVEGVNNWAPMITACRVEGSGAGAKRFCTMGDGTKLDEVIDEVDNEAMRFQYRITGGLPVQGFQGTILVKPVEGRKSEVTWYGAFESPAEQAEGFRQMIRDAYAGCIKGLEQHCNN